MTRSSSSFEFCAGFMRTLPMAAILAGALAVSACDAFFGTSVEERLSQGVDYYQQGEFSSAAIEFRNVLQEQPEHAQARFYLGVTKLRTGDAEGARRDLERALDFGFDANQLALPLARARLLTNDYASVLKMDAGEASAQDERAELHVLRGRAALGMDNPDLARAEFDEALAADPGSPSARYGQVLMARYDEDIERMRRWVERTLSADENYVEAWRQKALLETLEGRAQEAEIAWTRAITAVRPPQPQDLFRRGLLRVQRGAVDAAREDAEQLGRIASDWANTRYLMGLVALREGDFGGAQTELQAALAKNSGFAPARLTLGALHGDAGRYDQARYHLERYQRLMPESSIGLVAMAALEQLAGNSEGARDMLRSGFPGVSDDSASQVLRTLVTARGDAQPSIVSLVFSAMGFVDTEASFNADARRDGGETQVGANDAAASEPPADAIQEIEDALMRGDYQAAKDQSEALIEAHPGVARIHNLYAGALLGLGDVQAAVNALDKARSIDPGNATAVGNLAGLLERAGRRDDALALYRQGHEANPQHLGIRLELARLEYQVGDEARSNKLVEEAIERHPEALEPRLIHARRLNAAGDPEGALAAIAPLSEDHANNPDRLHVEARAREALNDHEEARRAWEALVQQQPNNPRLLMQLARSQMRLDDHADARESLARAAELEPSALEPRLLRIRTYVMEGDENRAAQAYGVLEQEFEPTREMLTEGARVAMARGNVDTAFDRLHRAQELAPSERGALMLAEVYQNAGRHERALEVIEGWYEQAQGSMSETGRHMLAALHATAGDEGKAISLYEEILRNSPDDPVMLNNLAWLIRETEPKRAATLARRASEQVPDSADVHHTLAVALRNAGELNAAAAAMKRAIELAPRPEFRLGLAEIFIERDQTEDARRVLGELTESQRRQDWARELMERLEQAE